MSPFKKISLVLGVFLLLATIGLLFTKNYLSDSNRTVPIVYSENAMLLELWNDYKRENLEEGSNRTLDKSQNNLTTSEGESYTMLRAVWMDDKVTFDNSWKFTKDNLQRDDKLFSWKFGIKNDGSYGILTDIGGQNTASDADIDIAQSLLMAYKRWNETSYLFEAREIIKSIWDNEVVMIQGKPVLVANDIEKNSTESVVVNPSYFAPYSFKQFSRVDPDNDWYGLADNSYDLLLSLSEAKLGSDQSSGMPPNWIKIDRKSGEFIANAAPNLDTKYGFDALRIPFRLALDYEWYKDPRDLEVLKKFSHLSDEWRENQELKAVYNRDGSVAEDYEIPAMYGGAIGYFNLIDPETADDVYRLKLQTLYSPDRQEWEIQLSYYDDNWAWFGLALTQKALPNLAESSN